MRAAQNADACVVGCPPSLTHTSALAQVLASAFASAPWIGASGSEQLPADAR